MRNGGHEENWNSDVRGEARVVIWDKGMPQESREIVYPGDSNYHMGEPLNESR